MVISLDDIGCKILMAGIEIQSMVKYKKGFRKNLHGFMVEMMGYLLVRQKYHEISSTKRMI